MGGENLRGGREGEREREREREREERREREKEGGGGGGEKGDNNDIVKLITKKVTYTHLYTITYNSNVNYCQLADKIDHPLPNTNPNIEL